MPLVNHSELFRTFGLTAHPRLTFRFDAHSDGLFISIWFLFQEKKTFSVFHALILLKQIHWNVSWDLEGCQTESVMFRKPNIAKFQNLHNLVCHVDV